MAETGYISDIEEKRKIGESWFRKLCPDKIDSRGKLREGIKDDYEELKRKAISEFLGGDIQKGQIEVDLPREKFLDKNMKSMPANPEEIIILRNIIYTVINKLIETYGEIGGYVQTYSQLITYFYSYMSGEKEVRTYLIFYKIISDIVKKIGFISTIKRDVGRKQIVKCMVKEIEESNKFNDTTDFLNHFVLLTIALFEDTPISYLHRTLGDIAGSKLIRTTELLIEKSIHNGNYDPLITIYFITYALTEKISGIKSLQNLFEDKKIGAIILKPENLEGYGKKYIERMKKKCLGISNSKLCLCETPSRVGGGRKRKKTRRKRRKRRKKCSKNRLKKKMICYRGSKKRLKKLEKYTKKLKLKLTRCSKKRLKKWKK